MDWRSKGHTRNDNSTVIARSEATKQSRRRRPSHWIASLGNLPLARNDGGRSCWFVWFVAEPSLRTRRVKQSRRRRPSHWIASLRSQ
ncbi:MAG: hypothetical protein LBT00_00690 [Spirochaetaceae bacterium]|nr:hypothetical protein [Spirochaetaceae bacterium]